MASKTKPPLFQTDNYYYQVGFTGTREGLTWRQRWAIHHMLQNYFGLLNFAHHGDCIGADEQFHNIAHHWGIVVHIHPPSISTYRAHCIPYKMDGVKTRIHAIRPYMERNANIVKACDILFAAPKEQEEPKNGGTWATIRMARKAHKDYIIFYPNGDMFLCEFGKGKGKNKSMRTDYMEYKK